MDGSARRCGSRSPVRARPRAPIGALLVVVFAMPWAALAAERFPGADSQSERISAYAAMLARAASAPPSAKLDAVNRFFNRLDYRADRTAWGRADHWSTPQELLALGAGDCEDLAIAKYFALRGLGLPVASLRITYTRDVQRNRPHMVLVHRGVDGRARVLDSGRDALSLLEARPELVPIYDFNEHGIAVIGPRGARHAFAHGGTRRLRQWDGLLRRAAMANPGAGPAAFLTRVSRGH